MRKAIVISGILAIVLVASISTGRKEPEDLIRIKNHIRNTEDTLNKIDSLSNVVEQNIALMERDLILDE